MNTSNHSCSRCGKVCKDKRGLTLHLKSCEGIKVLTCEFCNGTFVNQYTLSVHMSRCNEGKRHIQEQEQLLRDENQRLKDQLRELELKYQKEQADLKTSLRIDLERQLKIRDNDVFSLINDHKELEKNFEIIKSKYEMLEDEKKSLVVDKQTLIEMNTRLSLKDNNNTTIINQQNDNRVQLNCLDPSMIQGRIHPPDYVIGNVHDLMRMLRSLGIRNCFRVNDRSRGTLSWHKPGEGEVRDPTGDQMLSHIIDVLTPDITYEKCYYEDELKKLYSSHDPDVYQIGVYKTFVKFCSDLLKKDQELINDIKRELVKQGKAKNDNEVDQICEISYSKFVTSISLALFPNVMNWIEKSFYELGRYIGERIRDYYHIEGASREYQYIVIHSDNRSNLQVKASKLMTFIKEAIESIIDREILERILENILVHKATKPEQVQMMLSYLKNPTLEQTNDIMRGIVSL